MLIIIILGVIIYFDIRTDDSSVVTPREQEQPSSDVSINSTPTPTPTPTPIPYDYRTIMWGMTIDEVKASETAPLISEEASESSNDVIFLNYRIEVAGVPLIMKYRFDDGELVGIVYDSNDINDVNIDRDNVNQQFYKLYNWFGNLYGTPENEDNSIEIFGNTVANIKHTWQHEGNETLLWLFDTGGFARYFGVIMPVDGSLKRQLDNERNIDSID